MASLDYIKELIHIIHSLELETESEITPLEI